MADGDMGVSAAFENLGKQRMRWTPELRSCFEEAVNQLGGADRATPKGILKAMSIPGLTIGHVKSYLQKYRILKFSPESSERARLESRTISEVLPDFHATSRVQIAEALQVHMEVQRRSYQLEGQRHSKIKMELQRKYLDKITEEQGDFISECRPKKPSTLMMSSLCQMSKSEFWNQNSDSEIIATVINSSFKDFEAPKRQKVAQEAWQQSSQL